LARSALGLRVGVFHADNAITGSLQSERNCGSDPAAADKSNRQFRLHAQSLRRNALQVKCANSQIPIWIFNTKTQRHEGNPELTAEYAESAKVIWDLGLDW
jgi:hypothetical protein